MTRKFTLSIALALATATAGIAQTQYRVATNYGANGMAIAPKPLGEGDIYSAVQQSDGKLIAGGLLWSPAGSVDSAHLIRFKTNGTVDSSFGINGIRGTQTGFFVQGVRVIKMLAGDKFLVLGKTVTSSLATGFVTRYNADGSRDMSFNGGAAAILATPGANMYPTSMELQSDGKIIVGANKYLNGAPDSVFIYRLEANGAPDATFGTNGLYKLQSYFGSNASTRPVRIYVDGQDRIYTPLVASNAQPAPMQVLRLTKNGAPDAAFGTSGMSAPVTLPNNSSRFSLCLMPSGRIVAYGIVTGAAPTLTLSSFRLSSSGQLDNTYGSSGTADYQIGSFAAATHQNIFAIPNGEHLLMAFATTAGGEGYTTLADVDTTGMPGSLFGGIDTMQTLTLPLPNTGLIFSLIDMARMPDNAVYVWGTAGKTYGLVQKFVRVPTGLAPINSLLELKAFPNPAAASMKLQCAAGVSYAMYDMTGREVLRGTTASTETTLELSRLTPGTYTLVCSKDGRNASLAVTHK